MSGYSVDIEFDCPNCSERIVIDKFGLAEPNLMAEKARDMFVESDDTIVCDHCGHEMIADITNDFSDVYLTIEGSEPENLVIGHINFPDDNDDFDWYEGYTYTIFYEDFKDAVKQISEIVESSYFTDQNPALIKMAEVSVVTAMETFLGDAIKSKVANSDVFLGRAASKLDELRKNKVTVAEVLQRKDGVKGMILEQLSKYLYHDIAKVSEIYKAVLGVKFDYSFGEILKIVDRRHDIVHRNGKTKDGDEIQISTEIVKNNIREISEFVKSIELELAELDNESFNT